MWNPGWDELFRKQAWGRYPPEELVRFVARHFFVAAQRSDIRFLELGCGPGANLWFIAREGFQAYGLDGSAVALEQAKTRLEAEELRAELIRGDASRLPFPDHHFDCILDIECIYANSLKDSRAIIAEAHRALKPGGYLFSKTFMSGSSGDGQGKRLPGEPNTYVQLDGGALHREYGLVRFTDEREILDLYGIFPEIEYDRLVRSDKGRRHEIREWLITCRKAAK